MLVTFLEKPHPLTQAQTCLLYQCSASTFNFQRSGPGIHKVRAVSYKKEEKKKGEREEREREKEGKEKGEKGKGKGKEKKGKEKGKEKTLKKKFHRINI